MFHSFQIIFRQIRRNSFFSILKVGGLCIGFSVFILLLSIIRKELSYDNFWSNEKELYRVALEQYFQGELQIRSAKNYRGLPDLLVQEFPEVEQRVRIAKDMVTLFAEEQQIQDVDMFYCDSSLFSVLPLNIIDSEGSWPFADIHACLLSESMAMSLYGTKDVVGRELKLNEGWKFYISAVFEDIPANSHLKVDMFLNWQSLYYYMRNYNVPERTLIENPEWEFIDPGPYSQRSWNPRLAYSYIIVKEGTDISALQKKTEKLLGTLELPQRFEDTRMVPVFQAVGDIHLKSGYPDEIRANSSMYRIYMLLLIGSIVLIISWVNFINLFAIDFHEKTKDIAVRVINGAGSRHIHSLIWQKGLLLSLFSGILALLVIYLFSSLFGSRAAMVPGSSLDLISILVLLCLMVISALLTIIIPMSSFSSARTMDHLKGQVFGRMKGTNYRRLLVGLQFVSSIVLISTTIIIYLQMEFTRKKNLGFNPENIIYSFSPMTMNQSPEVPQKLIDFKNAMEMNPGVRDFSVSSSIPGKPLGFPGFTVYRSEGDREVESYLYRIHVDPGYMDTYQLEFLAGENFRDDHNYQVPELIINRSASELLGFSHPEDALGEFLRVGENQLSIVGVVEDYHHLSLKSELLPMVLFKNLFWYQAVGFYSFKLSAYDPEIIKRIGESWSEIYPGEQFIYSAIPSSYREQYRADRAFGSSFLIAAFLAILISCLGLLGLSKYNSIKRTREIGIRKTFGASSGSILFLLQSETILLLAISTIVGIPIAWVVVNRWLDNFVFHIDPAWWMFLLAFLLTFLVAIMSASVLSIRTARSNPVDTIRYE